MLGFLKRLLLEDGGSHNVYIKMVSWHTLMNRIHNEDIRKGLGFVILKKKWDEIVFIGLVIVHRRLKNALVRRVKCWNLEEAEKEGRRVSKQQE